MLDTDDEISSAVQAILDARPIFRVGDRVRVRIQMECQYCLDLRFPKCYEKAIAEDGRTGTVIESPDHDCDFERCDEEPNGAAVHHMHSVWVTWDERRPYDDPPLRVGDWVCPLDAHFAPTELELLP